MKKNKILVIHPSDSSTDCLKAIYEGRTDMDVLNDFHHISNTELCEIMKEYDKIIMLGHGCSAGLFDVHKGGLLINDTMTDILKEKETVSVWCFSDGFFRPRGIKGFHTGMIISEVGEEDWVLNSRPLDEEQMAENMKLFSECLRDCIDMSPEDMKHYMLCHYVGDDPVTKFNREKILVL